MEISEILRQFERLTGKFPHAAVEAAIEQRDEITPELLRILEDTLDRAEELAGGDEYMAHFYAMFLLAQFRETRAYPLMMRFAQLPVDILEDLCGDFVTETLGRVLASVCGGELKGIQSIIENEEADEWARGAALDALVTLVAVGEKSREEIVSYFASLFRGGMERRESFAWGGLVGSATDLWPEELLADIELAFAEGLTDEMCMDMEDVRLALANGKDASLADLARNRHHRLVEDTAKEFGGWACFQPQKARRDSRTTKGSAKPAMEPAIKPPAKLLESFAPVWQAASRIGRNDPCPCGSGKKYKKCCLQ